MTNIRDILEAHIDVSKRLGTGIHQILQNQELIMAGLNMLMTPEQRQAYSAYVNMKLAEWGE